MQLFDNNPILESISDGVFSVDHDWKISSFNRAAEKITGVKRSDAIGRYCSEVFRSSLCGAQCALRETLKTGKPIIDKNCYLPSALEGSRCRDSQSCPAMKPGEAHMSRTRW